MPKARYRVAGHCYSLKNHRPIFRASGGRIFIGKSKPLALYQRYAAAALASQHRGRAIETDVFVDLCIRYRGPKPDAFGPAETIFDCLQAAGVVVNDQLLVPRMITREHVGAREEEGVDIVLEW